MSFRGKKSISLERLKPGAVFARTAPGQEGLVYEFLTERQKADGRGDYGHFYREYRCKQWQNKKVYLLDASTKVILLEGEQKW